MQGVLPLSDSDHLESTVRLEFLEREITIADERAALRPMDYVQQQFLSLTRDQPIAISTLQHRRPVRR